MTATTVKLKDVIQKPLSGEWGDGEGETRVIRTTNFTNDGKLNLEEIVTRNIDLKKIAQKKLQFGDTIIEKSGGSPSQPVGRVVFFEQEDGDYLCNNFTSVIRAKPEINPRYLFWFLFYNHLSKNTLKYQNKTTGIINLQLERYIEEIEIPLPPLSTQKRIAEILEAADALRRKDQELLAKYDELAQAIFIDMFGDPVKNEKGWEVRRLGALCDVGSSRRVFVEELVDSGVPFFRGTEIGQMSSFDNVEPTLFVTQSHYEKLKKDIGVPKVGDLLMPSICPDGRIYEIVNDKPFYFKDGRVLWIKVNSRLINSVYLKKHLKAIFEIDYNKIASGTTFAELKIFALKEIILHYPPITIQEQFANRIQILEKQKLLVHESFVKSEALFHESIQKAFKGELIS